MKDISELLKLIPKEQDTEGMEPNPNKQFPTCDSTLEISPEIVEAEKKAMSLLQHMDRTEWELRDKLKKKEFSETAIEATIEYVRSFHYIDDQRYAIRFVELHREQRSMMRLKQDLYKRHVPDEYIQNALDEVERDDEPALREAVRKLARDRSISEYTYEEKRKLAGKLYRRGFQMNLIKKYLDI